MKLIKMVFLLLFCPCGVFSQTIADTHNLSDSLKIKLKTIDTYVKQINKRTDLKKESRIDILLNDVESTHTTYIDSITNQVCKTSDEKCIDYYHNGELIYTENRDRNKINITYFQNDKILFTTYHLDTEKILQIVYSTRIGKKDVNYKYLKLSEDSIIFSAGTFHSKSKYQIHQTNKLRTWRKLIKTIKLSDFDNIKNGKSLLSGNGEDIFIEITTEYHKIIKMNGYEDEPSYQKIKQFAETLASMVNKFNRKTNAN